MTQTTNIKLNKVQLNALENAVIATYEQGERAGADEGAGFICKYRGANNTKCLVGQMMADEDYKEEFDDGYIDLDLIVANGVIKNFGINEYELLYTLQVCHDEAGRIDFKGDFLANLERAYDDNKLPFELGNVINKLREDYERMWGIDNG